MKIEGIPDGWELVRIGNIFPGEYRVNNDGQPQRWDNDRKSELSNYVIIRKIEKPKQYRPFANAAEFEPHRDRWFRAKGDPDHCISTTAYNDRGHWTVKKHDTWEVMLERYTFDDGTPFGIEVTE